MSRKKRKPVASAPAPKESPGSEMIDVPPGLQAKLVLEARVYLAQLPHESCYACLLTPVECQRIGKVDPTVATVRPLGDRFFITFVEIAPDAELPVARDEAYRQRQALRDRVR